MIQFNSPEWFFLVPLLLAAGWKYKRLRLGSPLRLLLLACLLLALAQPVFNKGGSGMDLWVLVDKSNSAAGIPAAGAEEIQAILERHKHSGDSIRLVDFAQSAVLQGHGDPVFAGGTAGTDMEQALAYTMAQMQPDRVNRILMLTDGWPTTPLDHAAEQLIHSRIPVDYRLAVTRREADVRIEQIKTPVRIRPGEAFILEAALAGPPGPSVTVPWQISKNGGPPLKGEATLVNGKATVRLTDRLTTPGCSAYEMTITPQNDPIPENNRAVNFIEVTGGNNILLVSGYDRDPLTPYLEAQGFRVQRPANLRQLDARHLSGVGLVIINNLSASAIPADFLHALDYYVREQGGGLLMCGGRQSFGSGGYFSSPLDELLPVSMEMKKDKMKLITAMSIVLDRSGSMACSVSGGKTKMDLANAGACQTISLLSDQDFISVHAVDGAPHPIVTLTRLGPNRKQMLSTVSRIASMGGGIFIGEGLEAGWKELQRSVAGIRHLILFADADDSEEPANYRKTLKEMVKEGSTVSVIALGTEKSADAALLKEIAELGQGRIFFCDRPGDIPNIFAQETISVARAAFIRERTPLHGTAGWLQIAAQQPAWPPAVDGYNLCYLRDGATAACVTEDGNEAPLISFWNRGAGRAAAVTFAMGGEYGQTIQQWEGYGDLIQTLARWLNRQNPPQGYSVRADAAGDRLRVRLYYSDGNIPRLAERMPEVSMEFSGKEGSRTQNGIWEHLQPGVFQCSFPLPHGVMARGAVRIGNSVIPFGPVSQQVDPEWAMPPAAREAFLDLVSRTGGRERMDLPSIFQEPRPGTSLQLRPFLLWGACALLVLDALFTRTGLLPRRRLPQNLPPTSPTGEK